MSLPILNCDGCGACCREQESPPGYLSILVNGPDGHDQDDIERFNSLSPDQLAELNAYALHLRDKKRHPNDGICIWFDETTLKCRHYDQRPSICRETIECGDEYCLEWRAGYDIETPTE